MLYGTILLWCRVTLASGGHALLVPYLEYSGQTRGQLDKPLNEGTVTSYISPRLQYGIKYLANALSICILELIPEVCLGNLAGR